MRQRALILGVGGQDGSYLADILTTKNYEVYGMHRRSSGDNLWRIKHLLDSGPGPKVYLIPGDMADLRSIENALKIAQPNEVYNEADQDSVGWSHDCVSYSMDITGAAVGRLLESILIMSNGGEIPPKIRVFQPCTAMMFGDAAILPEELESPQTERTRFNPQSPYACAKVLSYYIARHYRYQHGMFVSTAILYNHDSPRRSDHYLLHKVCLGALRIKSGKQTHLALGNLDAKVDIGYAREYMEAAYNMLQLKGSDDFIISSGSCNTVGTLVTKVFDQVGIFDTTPYIKVDPHFYKESPKSVLVGDHSKATKAFGYAPNYNIDTLIALLLSELKGSV
jgi:GDPmannose 4,6-dehydratase